MKPFKTSRHVELLSFLILVGLMLGQIQSSWAVPVAIAVTVRVQGLYPNVATTVYVNGTASGTIYGEGAVSLTLLSYAQVISVDRYTPKGYPYYGYPYYSYPGPSWNPYGYNGVAFLCRSNSQTVSGMSTTVSFVYDTFFFLYVKSDRGNPQGTGWYPAGTGAPIAVVTPVEETGSTRYRFDRWVGGNVGDSATNPVNIVYMDTPKTVEASWIAQYKLTVNSLYGQISGGGWVDSGQSTTVSVTPSVDGGQGSRYIFNSWAGDYTGSSPTATIVMNGPKTVTATWRTQYLLTIDPKGGEVDKATQWLDGGTSVSVTAASSSNLVERSSRMIFQEWQGDSTSNSATISLVMDAPKTLVSIWKTQYYLVVETKCGAATGEGWYDTNSTAEFSVPSTVQMQEPLGTLGGKYVFAGWTGDSTESTSTASIVMNGAHVVKAIWNSDYTMVVIFLTAVGGVGAAAVLLVVERGKIHGLWSKYHLKIKSPVLKVGQAKPSTARSDEQQQTKTSKTVSTSGKSTEPSTESPKKKKGQ